MAYFGGSQGMRGDPGFFGTLFGVAKGAITGAVSSLIPRKAPGRFTAPQRQAFQVAERGRITAIQASGFLPGGPSPRISAIRGGEGVKLNKDGSERSRNRDGTYRKDPRMNPGNARALRRSIRRTDSFVRLARSALKNTGFKIASKSAGKLTAAAWQAKAHHAK